MPDGGALHQTMRRVIRRLKGRPLAPSLQGVAGPHWYDRTYATMPDYRQPYWRSNYYPLWTVIADRLRRDGLKQVLDIGCGPGQFAACLFDQADIRTYTGLDFSPRAIEMARVACPRGTFVVGDATTTRVHEETPHDVVICTEVLEHVPADHLVIERFTPGVRAICTVPNFRSTSHVRYFDRVDDVVARYERFFDRVDVWAVHGFRNDAITFFLIDGVRNSFRLAAGQALEPDFPPR